MARFQDKVVLISGGVIGDVLEAEGSRLAVAGLRGSPGAIAYCVTKWALRGMTKAAAIDFAPRGIGVNSVHPGPIDTEVTIDGGVSL